MKKLALVMTLFVGAFTTAQAQNKAVAQEEQSPYAAQANKETDKLDRIVKLTPEQKTKIYNINLSLAQRTTIIEKSDNPDKKALAKELEGYRSNMYLQTLTPEQAEAYKKSTQ